VAVVIAGRLYGVSSNFSIFFASSSCLHSRVGYSWDVHCRSPTAAVMSYAVTNILVKLIIRNLSLLNENAAVNLAVCVQHDFIASVRHKRIC